MAIRPLRPTVLAVPKEKAYSPVAAHTGGTTILRVAAPPATRRAAQMKWTKPEVEVIELGMEIGAYAGSA